MCNVPNEVITSIYRLVASHAGLWIDRKDREDVRRKADEGAEILNSWVISLPVAPEPDWSTAPEWAMWWACSPGGFGRCFEVEPSVEWDEWTVPFRTREQPSGYIGLPIGIDWRTTKRKRPE